VEKLERKAKGDESGAQMSDDGSKANVFFKSPHGDGHIQIAAADDAETIQRLIKNTGQVLEWCKTRGFESRPQNGTADVVAGAAPAASVKCGICRGPAYDNSQKKSGGWNGPTYKCKAKHCAATDWAGTGEWKQE
jgi:hypothetical protein